MTGDTGFSPAWGICGTPRCRRQVPGHLQSSTHRLQEMGVGAGAISSGWAHTVPWPANCSRHVVGDGRHVSLAVNPRFLGGSLFHRPSNGDRTHTSQSGDANVPPNGGPAPVLFAPATRIAVPLDDPEVQRVISGSPELPPGTRPAWWVRTRLPEPGERPIS